MACRAPRGGNLPLSTAAAAGVPAEPNNYIPIPTSAATGSATGVTSCSSSAPNTTTGTIRFSPQCSRISHHVLDFVRYELLGYCFWNSFGPFRKIKVLRM